MCQWWIQYQYLSWVPLNYCVTLLHTVLSFAIFTCLTKPFLPLKMRETENKRVIDIVFAVKSIIQGLFFPTRIVRVVTDKLRETQSIALSKNNCRQWSLLEKVSWHDLFFVIMICRLLQSACVCILTDRLETEGRLFTFMALCSHVEMKRSTLRFCVENESDVREWFSSLSFFSLLLVIAA